MLDQARVALCVLLHEFDVVGAEPGCVDETFDEAVADLVEDRTARDLEHADADRFDRSRRRFGLGGRFGGRTVVLVAAGSDGEGEQRR